MAAMTSILLGVGLAVGAAGAYTSYQGSREVAKGNRQAEAARRTSMNLDAARRRRAIIREIMAANAQNTAMAAATGTMGSSLMGGMAGTVAGQGGNNLLGVSQNQQLGNDIFDANARTARGSSMSSMGEGLQSLGGAIVRNRESISRIGQFAFNR